MALEMARQQMDVSAVALLDSNVNGLVQLAHLAVQDAVCTSPFASLFMTIAVYEILKFLLIMLWQVVLNYVSELLTLLRFSFLTMNVTLNVNNSQPKYAENASQTETPTPTPPLASAPLCTNNVGTSKVYRIFDDCGHCKASNGVQQMRLCPACAEKSKRRSYL